MQSLSKLLLFLHRNFRAPPAVIFLRALLKLLTKITKITLWLLGFCNESYENGGHAV